METRIDGGKLILSVTAKNAREMNEIADLMGDKLDTSFNIEKLELRDCEITTKILKTIGLHGRNLLQIDFTASKIDLTGFHHLQSLKHLKDFCLNAIKNANQKDDKNPEDKLVDTIWDTLKQLPKLKSLDIRNIFFRNTLFLNAVTSFKNLQVFKMDRCMKKDELNMLAHSLPKLTWFDSRQMFTPEEIKALEPLTNLSIFNTNTTGYDELLTILNTFPKLKSTRGTCRYLFTESEAEKVKKIANERGIALDGFILVDDRRKKISIAQQNVFSQPTNNSNQNKPPLNEVPIINFSNEIKVTLKEFPKLPENMPEEDKNYINQLHEILQLIKDKFGIKSHFGIYNIAEKTMSIKMHNNIFIETPAKTENARALAFFGGLRCQCSEEPSIPAGLSVVTFPREKCHDIKQGFSWVIGPTEEEKNSSNRIMAKC